MNHLPGTWLRWGLLVALVITTGLLQSSLTAIQAQGGGTLIYGSKVFGTISEDLPRITYSFTGAPGDVVNVMVERWMGNLNLRTELVAPNGLVLDSRVQNTLDDSPLGATVSAVLPDEGIYLLWISGEDGTTGEFTLTLLGRAAVTSTPLIFGQAVNVIVPLDAPPQFYSFEAEDCPTTLLVSEPSAGQPFAFPFVVKVHDQRGQPVALLRGGEQIEDWVTVAPRSGRYEVEVTAADPSLTGSIRLLVTCSRDAPGCAEGQAGIPGVVTTAPTECEPCPSPGELTEGGGCPDLHFALEQAPDDPFRITVRWEVVPGATGYVVYVYGRYPDGGEVYLTHAEWVAGNPTAFTWPLPDAFIGFRFALRVTIDDALVCIDEASLAFEAPPPQQGQFPCLIRTDRADVQVRVGPGMGRGVFAFLAAGVEYPVIGQVLDEAGNLWWQIDKTLIPGHEAVVSLWVLATDVTAIGDCDQVPPGDAPPLIPWEPEEPPPGQWLPCGSCDTCGHPAAECVTSPEGECLWDPATCALPPPDVPPDDDEPPGTECYIITVTVVNECEYSAASAMIDVAPNCDGGYAPGTTISAHAVAVDPKCNVSHWSGCGVSGDGNSVSFTATRSCTLTAHMHYGN